MVSSKMRQASGICGFGLPSSSLHLMRADVVEKLSQSFLVVTAVDVGMVVGPVMVVVLPVVVFVGELTVTPVELPFCAMANDDNTRMLITNKSATRFIAFLKCAVLFKRCERQGSVEKVAVTANMRRPSDLTIKRGSLDVHPELCSGLHLGNFRSDRRGGPSAEKPKEATFSEIFY